MHNRPSTSNIIKKLAEQTGRSEYDLKGDLYAQVSGATRHYTGYDNVRAYGTPTQEQEKQMGNMAFSMLTTENQKVLEEPKSTDNRQDFPRRSYG